MVIYGAQVMLQHLHQKEKQFSCLLSSINIIIIIFFQFGTGGNAQEGQACSKCAHLSHTREPIRIKWGRTL